MEALETGIREARRQIIPALVRKGLAQPGEALWVCAGPERLRCLEGGQIDFGGGGGGKDGDEGSVEGSAATFRGQRFEDVLVSSAFSNSYSISCAITQPKVTGDTN
jgi:hypothetical protein